MTAPTVEVQALSQSIRDVQVASDALFDRLDTGEKALGRRRAQGFGSFDPANAAYFATIPVDAPRTAELRAAMALLTAYTQLVANRIAGKDNDAVIANLQSIAATVGLLTAGPGAATAVAALVPALQKALAVASQAQAKALVLGTADPFLGLIAELRGATPSMYQLLVASALGASLGSPVGDVAIQTREILSNYVVLLDRLKVSYEHLLASYNAPNDINLLALTRNAATLSSDAAALRKAIQGLR